MPRISPGLFVLLVLVASSCGGPDDRPDPQSDAGTPVDADDEEIGEEIGEGVGVLVINEVAAVGEPDDWFEILNAGTAPVSLAEVTFSDSIEDPADHVGSFPASLTIAPGEFLRVQFDGSYPGFGFGAEEQLGLFGPDGALLDGISWPSGASPQTASFGRIPDGTGRFKTLLTPTPGAANLDNPGGSSCGDDQEQGEEQCDDGNQLPGDGCTALCQEEVCGNRLIEPGEQCDDGDDEPGDGCDAECRLEFTPDALVINEIAAALDVGVDFIELFNTSDEPVNVSGWTLTDDDQATHRHTIEGRGALAPGGYLLLERDVDFDFGLGEDDSVRLFDEEGQLVDVLDWAEGQSPPGASFGRLPNGSGAPTTLFRPSPGAQNLPNTP